MDLIGISFDIYVLSWPVIRVASEQSDIYTVSPKNQDTSPEVPQKSTSYFDFEHSFSATTSDVISQLPRLVRFR